MKLSIRFTNDCTLKLSDVTEIRQGPDLFAIHDAVLGDYRLPIRNILYLREVPPSCES